MRVFLFLTIVLLASCGAPSEEKAPEQEAPAAPDTEAVEKPKAELVVPEGNVTISKQVFSDCQFEYEVETDPYLRYSEFKDGKASYQLGFWSNCCGEKQIVGQLDGRTLTLLLAQEEKGCKCNCCYSLFVEVDGLTEDPETVLFLDAVLKSPKS